MYEIHRYVNYITVLIYIYLIVLKFFQKVFFIRDLCLIRDDYIVFNNCAITKEELFKTSHLCTSLHNNMYVFN